MSDESKTKAQLIEEVADLRRRVADLMEPEAVRERSEDLIMRLNALLKELLVPGSVSKKLRLITDGVVKIFGADFARIWITKPGDRCDSGCIHAAVTEGPHVCRYRNRCLHLMASSGRYTHLDGEVHRRVPFGCYKIGRVAAGDDSRFLTNDVTHDPRVHDHDWARALGLASFAGYRLLSGTGRPIGVLALFSQQAISHDEDVLLEGLAHTTAQVVQAGTAEEALEEREKEFRTVLETTADPLIVYDRQGKAEYLNPAFTRDFGWTSEELLGQKIDFVPEENLSETIGAIEATYASGDSHITFESRRYTKSGEIRDVIVSAALWREKDGTPKGTVVSLKDITERKRSEKEMQKLAAVVKHSRELVNLATLDGKMIFLNEAGGRMLGIDPDEVERVNIMEVIPDHLIGLVEDELLPRLISGDTWEGDLQYRNLLTGKLTDVHAITFTVKDPDTGEPLFLANVSLDITDRILAERELRQLEDRLMQGQKMEAIGTLASGIAHDFNNILQAISGYVEIMLAEEKTIPANRDHLQKVGVAAERASELVRRLLTFGRKAEAEPRPINLNEEILQTVRLLEHTIPKMISIETHLDEDLKNVNADPQQIEQVVMNLGVNAADAMPDGGTFVVETRNVTLDEAYTRTHPEKEPGDYVLLKVSDSGHGMDEKTVKHIFEPFFTTKGVGEGTGLGLSTVYGIVTGYGGSVTCHSQPGEGTIFEVYLPATERQVSPSVIEAVGGYWPYEGEETILVVDDEKAIVETAQEALESSGYTALKAFSGEEALQAYQKNRDRIDLVILDLGMPGMGGQECLGKLKEIDPEVKVVVATGYLASGLEIVLREAGASGFVAKPYRLTDLLREIRSSLDTV
ncbi:MAG: PAS domain S-box protein [Proteobacteria bacterium]|nr:PAS domain S-box protein [Pseudomonadota bacterium]MBU1742561.1 PAS domain S-box protein [Pseudomonadota bacterium]